MIGVIEFQRQDFVDCTKVIFLFPSFYGFIYNNNSKEKGLCRRSKRDDVIGPLLAAGYYLYSLKRFQCLRIPDERNKATKVGAVKLC